MKVRVRFNRNVLMQRAGTVAWVEATPMVERLVQNGYLTWLDEPTWDTAATWEPPAPDPDAPWYLDEQDALAADDDEITLPSGETIPLDELMERLDIADEELDRLEDDGGR